MSKHFKLSLPDAGKDVYMPRKTQTWGYRYGPSIMVEGDVCRAWFASPGDCFEADWFTYRESYDKGETWTRERVVLTPTPDSMDWFSVCDPAVFKYGKYYYIGYTSTIFADGGGVCNNGFVARSEYPDGPFFKWTGKGWGEYRDGCAWMGSPAPIIYYDEDWKHWGAGEFSFVVKDDVLYIYYTWTSKNIDGKTYSQTRVATADITREDWPATIVQHGVAAVRNSTGNDSYDVVYCEELDKFIALSTDKRFSADSFLSVSESDDGLRFTRVNDIRTNTCFMLHNCGISGDAQHHIKQSDTLLLGYAYGNQWGKWGTRMHRYAYTLMDEDYYSELDLPNLEMKTELWEREAELPPMILTAAKPHYIRVKPGTCAPLVFVTYNSCYEPEIIDASQLTFDNYDKSIVEIKDGKVFGKQVGYTYVDAHLGSLCGTVLVYVDAPDTCYDTLTRTVVTLTPMLDTYYISLAENVSKQIRAMAQWSDGKWYEVSEPEQGISYQNHNPELISVDERGVVLPISGTGTARVTLRAGDKAFDVNIVITE